MEKALLYSRIALALAGAFAFICIGIMVLGLQPIVLHLNGVLTRAEGLESKLNATLVNLDKGTRAWSDSSKDQAAALTDLATDAHGTLSGANRAIDGISVAASTLNDQVAHVGQLLDSAKAATDSIPPVMKSSQADLDSLKVSIEKTSTSVDLFNKIISDPNIALTGKNVEGLTRNADLASEDFQRRFHDILYPPPCHKWGCVWKFAYPFLKDGAALGESVYWTAKLF